MCLIISACNNIEKLDNARTVDALPEIFPAYIGTTLPPNIAPLNFSMKDDDTQRIDVVVTDNTGAEAIHVQGTHVAQFDIDAWHELLARCVGDSIVLTVSAKRGDKWTTYKPFPMYVSADSIDFGLVYRLIEPGYEVYSEMSIKERDLSCFRERTIVDNSDRHECMNCHSFRKCDPTYMSLHVRGTCGATLLSAGGALSAYETRTAHTLNFCAYPYWHPSGKFIAYATNQTRQGFHVGLDKKFIEGFDLNSDLQVYDIEAGELLVAPHLAIDSIWENFTTYSADGRTIYFCSSPKRKLPTNIEDAHYSLLKVDFDPDAKTFGHEVDTLVNSYESGKSVSIPRPSYDGRFLMYNVLDYGNYPNFHPDADLWLMDLRTGQVRALDEVNSSNTESSHSWSSNSRWFVFSSRRMDERFNRPFICHIDTLGQCTRPFVLPQEDPKTYYDDLFKAYNIPEFISSPSPVTPHEARHVIDNGRRIQMKARKVD